MKHTELYRSLAVFILLMALGAPVSKVFAQNPDGALNELKKKYPWGHIYLTFIPISDITGILNTPRHNQEISKQEGSQIVSTLTNFLNTNKRDQINRALAFIEINLNTMEAGFKWADDHNGVVIKIPWSPAQVLQIAVICDKHLNGN